MGRCIYCHSVVTKEEDYCYTCGDHIPKQAKAVARQRPVSALTNFVFLASLAFTAYCFFGEHKLSLPVTLAGVVWHRLLWLGLGLFCFGWLLQFVGHAIEGKPPEFLKDWRFLLVGSRWWAAKMRGKA